LQRLKWKINNNKCCFKAETFKNGQQEGYLQFVGAVHNKGNEQVERRGKEGHVKSAAVAGEK